MKRQLKQSSKNGGSTWSLRFLICKMGLMTEPTSHTRREAYTCCGVVTWKAVSVPPMLAVLSKVILTMAMGNMYFSFILSENIWPEKNPICKRWVNYIHGAIVEIQERFP